MTERFISRYRIVRKLGAGGMGDVYLADDPALGRPVALKLLLREHADDDERLRRFTQEAKAASALNHPNILTVHEIGTADGQPFMATEYVDGETLRARITRAGALDPREALDIARQVASALAAAHDAAIVHRDLKPENIMVRRDGYVKVLDFGLAKLLHVAPVDPSALTTMGAVRTESYVVLGTAPYMSPEQASGQPVDTRSDIFSFGAVLYEMVSGERAFQRPSAVETAAAVINQDPKPLPAAVPPDVGGIIARCLRKDPARRYQSMAELRIALEDVSDQSRTAARSTLMRRRWRARSLYGAVAAVMLLAIVAGWFLWQRRRTPGADVPLQAVPLTTLPGVEQTPSLSPDGNYVVFAWNGPAQDNQDIYIQMIGSGSPLQLTRDPLHDYNPVWSPDGRWIAFFRSQPPAPTGVRRRELRLIPPLGGPERKLADITGQDFFPVGAFVAWAADSRSLIVTDSPGEGEPDALFAVSIETGAKRRLTRPRPPVLADTSPALSPDGRALVFVRRTTWGAGELHLLPLTADLTAEYEPTRLTALALRADYPAWMPGGKEIVFAAKARLWRMPVDGSAAPALVPYIGDEALTPAVSRPPPGQPARLVYVRSLADSNFWRLETSAGGVATSSRPVRVMTSTRPEYHVQLSPDGRRIAFTSLRTGDAEIWTADPDGANAVQLTSLGAQDSNCASWSPDGQSVAFSSNAEGEFDLYTVPAAGGRPLRLTSHPAVDLCPAYSHDGAWIYFSSMRSGDYRIWRMPATGGEAVQVSPDSGGKPSEDQSGRYVHYTAVAVESPLWRAPTTLDGDPVKLVDGVLWFNYVLVDRGIYYVDRDGAETRLRFFDNDSGRVSTIAGNLGEISSGLTATPDGRTILFTRMDTLTDDVMLVENFR